MKTLKVLTYRGKKIYIRHLFKESFEFLIIWNNEILEKLIEFSKERKHKNRQYTELEIAKIIDTLQHIAQEAIDDKKGRSIINKFNNYFNAKHRERNQRAVKLPVGG